MAEHKSRRRAAKAQGPAQDPEQGSNLQTDRPDEPIPSEQPREQPSPDQPVETPQPQQQPHPDEQPQQPGPTQSPTPEEQPRPVEQQPGAKARYRSAPPAPEPSAERPAHPRDIMVGDQQAEHEQMQEELARARRVHDARTAGEKLAA